MLKRPELFINGFHIVHFPLSEEVSKVVQHENWPELEHIFQVLTKKGGALYRFLQEYHQFEEIEFIISLRDAKNEWEEDGIWHDDGSRLFAFSLSLTVAPDTVKGGRLGIRRIGEREGHSLPTLPFGGLIMFLTGAYGFEHKIHRVSAGRRIIIAGWCS